MRSAAHRSEQHGEPPVIDARLGVQVVGKPERWLRLLDMFAAELPASLGRLDAAFDNGQIQEVGRIAHKLRGSASYCGTPAFEQAVAALNLACRREVPLAAEVGARLDLLRKEAGRLLQAIEADDFPKE